MKHNTAHISFISDDQTHTHFLTSAAVFVLVNWSSGGPTQSSLSFNFFLLSCLTGTTWVHYILKSTCLKFVMRLNVSCDSNLSCHKFPDWEQDGPVGGPHCDVLSNEHGDCFEYSYWIVMTNNKVELKYERMERNYIINLLGLFVLLSLEGSQQGK